MWKKNCPTCGKEQTYSWEIAYSKAVKSNSSCRSCTQKACNQLRPQNQKGFKNSKLSGSNNAMYGRTFIDVWREKYDEDTVNQLRKLHADKSKHIGKDNAMHGKSWYNVIRAKHGEDADSVIDKWKNNRKVYRGSDNPSYGKPAHKLSGRGVKGEIYGIFFRSLLELQYIYHKIKQGHSITNAETIEYRVNYSIHDQQKTYHPDFLLDGKFIVEVKPSKLLSSNSPKIEAAKERYGDLYLIETEKSIPNFLDQSTIDLLIQSGDLIISDKEYVRAIKGIKRYYKKSGK